jgi:integrase
VALSPAALAELRTLPHREGLLYPGPSSSDGMRNEFSDMALTAVIRRLDSVEPGRWHDPKMQRLATVHGLRSTFRTWVAESTSHAPALAEAALAHVSGDAVEQAYQRGDMLERRRALMADWAGFVLGTPKLALVKAGGKKVTA